MAQLFEEAGYTVVTKGKADICVVNTCTVTETGAAKSMKMIRRARRENPDGVLAVCGCLSQTEPERIKNSERIDVLIGNKYRNKIVSLCEAAIEGKSSEQIEDILKIREFEELGTVCRQRRIRAEIKIEDGCNNFCTYCKIPYARGPVRSRNIENIVKEAKRLKESGYSEIVLTGIHIASYGMDLNEEIGLIDVMESVSKACGGLRLRLGSIEPKAVTEEFVKRAVKVEGLCPQFHLSLQSGCDKILSLMHRRYTTSDFETAVKNLRESFTDAAITTDLIVGFPCETEADFEESKSFCERMQFARMHIFPYSERTGTKATELEPKVSDADKTRRTAIMLNIAERMRKDFCEKYKGQTVSVLFEQEKDGMLCGTTENYIDVRVPYADLRGKTADVKITDYRDGYLVGGI